MGLGKTMTSVEGDNIALNPHPQEICKTRNQRILHTSKGKKVC